jgi:hypothetical protein
MTVHNFFIEPLDLTSFLSNLHHQTRLWRHLGLHLMGYVLRDEWTSALPTNAADKVLLCSNRTPSSTTIILCMIANIKSALGNLTLRNLSGILSDDSVLILKRSPLRSLKVWLPNAPRKTINTHITMLCTISIAYNHYPCSSNARDQYDPTVLCKIITRNMITKLSLSTRSTV